MKREAIFSDDRRYRYLLKREWDKNKPCCNFICMNPSIADDELDDNTVTICIEQAKRLGFGRIEITNLFAYIDTDGSELYSIEDPVGEDNDRYISESATRSDKVIVAWGNDGCYRNRSDIVLDILKNLNIRLYCLKLNSTGQPHHPTRLGYVEKLIRY